MAYRDEHEALRARLAATELRLRVAEEELANARQHRDEPLIVPPAGRSYRVYLRAVWRLRATLLMVGTGLALVGAAFCVSLLALFPGATLAAVALLLNVGALVYSLMARARGTAHRTRVGRMNPP